MRKKQMLLEWEKELMTDVKEFLEDFKDFVLWINVSEGAPWRGNLYHKVMKREAGFNSLLDMALMVENICECTGIPKANMEVRRFKSLDQSDEGAGEKSVHCSEQKKGEERVLLFRLHLQYRSHASWQGWIERIDTGLSAGFGSFLNLVEQLCGILWKEAYGEELEQIQLEERTPYKGIPVDEFIQASPMQAAGDSGVGRLLWMVTGKETRFSGSCGVLWLPKRKASFQVNIKFQRNHTWQGTVRWLENKEELQFRSLLELLKITDYSYE